ncbi:hypothetical protein O181_048041 [Austropuccinia psidii MF-1]|uniref:Integrase catalytic domain-containing protein n=1 Tax=Austropuccinia psidii MF-1 TaxID=1389203 RepID=A0A9Q3DX88_9BASI|nr:hypothetical protein [Austropuccinia psidii MF-1]
MNNTRITNLVKSRKGKQICDICLKGKITALPFSSKFVPANSILENIHLDLCAPISTPTISGYQYFMIIIDQFSKFISVKLLKRKNKSFTHLKEFKNAAESFHSNKIKRIISDGGGKFKNNYSPKAELNIVLVQLTPRNTTVSPREETSLLLKMVGAC